MEKIAEYQALITKLIDLQDYKKEPPELYDPIIYVMSQGGKRLRPMFTLLACDMFGGDITHALYPALAIEMFHSFTLIHDDIMDKAPIRRGEETVYKKWNSDIAILSGDTLFAMAYQNATQTDNRLIKPILEVFSKTAIEVCEGQQYDMNFETARKVSLEEYIEMIRLKTAVLIGASVKIGAIAAGADYTSIRNLYDFGVSFGLAFQLMDDLLDVYGNLEQFGKIRGGDIASNKKTYLYLKALELGDKKQKKQLKKLYSNKRLQADEKINQVVEIYNQLNIRNEVVSLMEQYYKESLRSLDAVVADERKKEVMRVFTWQLYNRNY